MIDKQVFIDYKENGVPVDAYSVVLASENAFFGVKEAASNVVLYPTNTAVDHTDTGHYQITLSLEENTVYVVSWQVIPNFGDQPKYVIQQIGPYEGTRFVRAVADQRGKFIQATRGTFFIRITDTVGTPRDADPISCTVRDQYGTVVVTGNPERAGTGFYAYDWDIDQSQAAGTYDAVWLYTVDGSVISEVQEIVVAPMSTINPPSLYAGRILEFRQSLEYMIGCAQSIPVYSEQAKPSADHRMFMFSFERWNQSPGCRIYVNDEIQTQGLTIDYFRGTVLFDTPLTRYDRVKADYNFRWFSDVELDRFLSNAVNLVNLWPPVSMGIGLMNLPERYIPLVLYAAAVDAIRRMMMCLNFQQPQMVFGGADAASKVYSNLEGLKKNYEETFNSGIEQKKNGPYVGLTKTIVTPEFALPGGRSRWFRYLFSSGV